MLLASCVGIFLLHLAGGFSRLLGEYTCHLVHASFRDWLGCSSQSAIKIFIDQGISSGTLIIPTTRLQIMSDIVSRLLIKRKKFIEQRLETITVVL